MSEHPPAVRFDNVGKMYKIFSSRAGHVLDILGLDGVLPRRRARYREFWALRGIDFELGKGERLGIIGRNGAGKTTLLKLVTGNLAATEGDVVVDGDVQALLEIGGGLHPEFTGRENIHAALVHLGLTAAEIKDAEDDIDAFTELGRFLDQPFKTYSQGMQARLSIAIATAIQPEILIIDEILGAGDAYFFSKSTARMEQLLEEGASVLLVSHALDQVERFCAETIWIDRGRIVMRGPTSEVVKAYQKFIRDLDDRRLTAKNRKAPSSYDAFERESYTDQISVHLVAAGAACDIDTIELVRDGTVEERIDVGEPQDGDFRQQAYIALTEHGWEDTAEEADGSYFRRLEPTSPAEAIFNLWFFYHRSHYRVRVRYRSPDGALSLSLSRAGRQATQHHAPPMASWTWAEIALGAGDTLSADDGSIARSRWSGSGSFLMTSVRLLDDAGEEAATFSVGRPLSVEVEIAARATGRLPLIPAALVFRPDGIVVTRHVAEEVVLDVQEGDVVNARLDLGPLLLGNGVYLLSLGLYAQLDVDDIQPSEYYDYFDRSFEFRVVGNPRLHNEVVRHPGAWRIDAPVAKSRAVS
jgi:lipopolysaccharide transport system ATP-binding protein